MIRNNISSSGNAATAVLTRLFRHVKRRSRNMKNGAGRAQAMMPRHTPRRLALAHQLHSGIMAKGAALRGGSLEAVREEWKNARRERAKARAARRERTMCRGGAARSP